MPYPTTIFMFYRIQPYFFFLDFADGLHNKDKFLPFSTELIYKQ